MNLTVTIRHADDISIIDLRGNLTSFEADGLQEAIRRLKLTLRSV